jgi:catalase
MPSAANSSPEFDRLVQQAADAFLQAFGNHPGMRLAHAKGIVCNGEFVPAKTAAAICKALHFSAGKIPIIVRFSDATGLPNIPDGHADSNPKGMAIRFNLPGGKYTDIVANAKSGFVVGTPTDFVAVLTAMLATKPDSPKPTPIEQFMGAHPRSLAYASRPALTPASFVSQTYFGNNAFVFVNAAGKKQATRYQIVPVSGDSFLDPETVAGGPPDFLMDELKARIARAPAEFRLLAQIAKPGDPTSDATQLWPDDREKIELGTVRITGVDPASDETQRGLTFDPMFLTDGIEPSDDPLPAFRSAVYVISAARRKRPG